jgi:hypothetical protein
VEISVYEGMIMAMSNRKESSNVAPVGWVALFNPTNPNSKYYYIALPRGIFIALQNRIVCYNGAQVY